MDGIQAPTKNEEPATTPLFRAETSRTARSSATAHTMEHTRVAAFDGTFAPEARPPFQPGTRAWYRKRDYFLSGWSNPAIWRSTLVEFVGTAAIVLVGGQIGATIASYGTPQVGAYIALSNIVLLTIFIYATAPASGGHLNPMITFSTMLTGLCPWPRGVLYMCAQTAGAAVGGGVLTGIWGRQLSIELKGGGCFFDLAYATYGQLFLNEIASSFVLLLLAFGVGLDPRQALLFGPRFGPLLVGATVGVMSFAGSGMIRGYAGASLNPARCFALGIVRRDLSGGSFYLWLSFQPVSESADRQIGQWIWWAGDAIAGILLAAMYNLIPPHHGSGKPDPDSPGSCTSDREEIAA
ncbi:aquaporin-like protein [Lasiosphaeris hirsuta]|uniref:Aquaporin-like protein n=1 Tax=Lasiosphaeris hirsuta TaxID=260670 RepID=A0AA40BDC3_9PEZI|nr:aquaporin-like protein [Lasiosphaeris hirsuta]